MGLKPDDGLQVDHRNRNRLDNRRTNLRIVTHAQNMHNKSLYCNSTSGFRGVTWSQTRKQWRARVGVDGKRIHLGYFKHKHDAAEAAQKGRLRLLSHAID